MSSGFPLPFPFGRPPHDNSKGSNSSSSGGPTAYPWSDHIYMFIVQSRLQNHIAPPLSDARKLQFNQFIQKVHRGISGDQSAQSSVNEMLGEHGLTPGDLAIVRAQHKDMFLKGRCDELRADVERYHKGQPLGKTGVKQLVFYREAFWSGIGMGILYVGVLGFNRIMRGGDKAKARLTQKHAKSRAALQAQLTADAPELVMTQQGNAAVNGLSFYGGPITNAQQRGEELIQREVYLREIFRHGVINGTNQRAYPPNNHSPFVSHR